MAFNTGRNVPTEGLFTLLDASYETVSKPLKEVEVLVVAGGGGGGMDMGGGGGGGGVIYKSSYSVTPGTVIGVEVGTGGNGAPAGGTTGQGSFHQFQIRAQSGQNSKFGELNAIGGGYGASSYWGYTPDYGSGGSGGSGGGASGYSDGTGNNGVPGVGGRGGDGTRGQGFDGGDGTGQYYSGGGGGAGEAGHSAYLERPHGGRGLPYSLLGTTYYWGGGGGGAGYSYYGGNGGLGGGGGGAVGNTFGGDGYNNGSPGGGGGTGTWANTPGGNAGANTGGGGGGGAHYNATNQGGNGGSGIVIVRYPGPRKANGGNIIQSINGNTVHIYNSGNDSFTPLTESELTSTPYGFEDVAGINTPSSAGSITYDSNDGGGCYVLNNANGGTSQYFRLDNPSYRNPGQDKTIFAWVKINSSQVISNTYTGIFSIGGRYCPGGESVSTLLSVNTNGSTWYVSSAYWCNDYVPNTTEVTKDEWNFVGIVARTRPGSNNCSLFVGNSANGFTYDTGSTSTNTNTLVVDPGIMMIGATDVVGRNISAKYGSVYIYDKELSSIEIEHIYNSTKSRYGL